MKKQCIITVLVCLLIVGGGAGVLLWPRTVPLGQCSEVYKTYANNPSIKASFIKDFRINDSVTVNVTLLEAVDSNGWNMLYDYFHFTLLDSASQKDIDNGMDIIYTKRMNKNDYQQPINDSTDEAVIRAVSHLRKTVSIFHTKNKEEEHSVLYYNFDKTVFQNKESI